MDKKMGGRLEEREGREFCAVNKKGNSKENQEREWTAGLPSKVYLDNDKRILSWPLITDEEMEGVE